MNALRSYLRNPTKKRYNKRFGTGFQRKRKYGGYKVKK